MPDDDLTRAAQRAREVLPGPIGDCVAARLEIYIERQQEDRMEAWRAERADALAAAVLALPASAPDRDALIDYVRVAVDRSGDERDEEVVDALISAGLVRGPVTAEQVENCARELHRRDLGDVDAWWHESEHRRDMWRSKARTAAKALGLSVEGDETHG